jgi:hypothetical protein
MYLSTNPAKGTVMRFDNILQCLKAGATLRRLPVRANTIHLRHAGFPIFLLQMRVDFFIAERVAEANHHGDIFLQMRMIRVLF